MMAVQADRVNAWQQNNASLYRTQMRPLLNKSNPMKRAPGRMPSKFTADFQLLLDLSRDADGVFALMQEFEREVLQYSMETGKSLEDSFLCQLEKLENYYGFVPAICVRDFLNKKDFLELLAQGYALADDHWIDTEHTRDSHRLMSVLHARYLERTTGNREAYIELYRFMGNVQWTLTADWNRAGFNTQLCNEADLDSMPDLFGMLYDTKFFTNAAFNVDAQDFTNPCFMAKLRPFVPALCGWQ